MAGNEAPTLEPLRVRAQPIPMDAEQRREWQRNFNRLPAMTAFGAQIDLSDARLVRVHMAELQEHHRGGLGTSAANGAVIAGLLDCALGVAGTLQFIGKRAGTVELSLKFLRPVPGPSVTAYAVTLKKADSVAFAESHLFCKQRLCAIATGMVAVASAKIEKEELRW